MEDDDDNLRPASAILADMRKDMASKKRYKEYYLHDLGSEDAV
eukprot:CAMPEP_0197725666 /NCGR_PEP_ID=MMETSP1434-20131217/9105_1 /TAXON_ID=265543 /ORGANISM="Minutocellus polymorphus, Strain CCMP3303" /LENGTH=42 /DNA_ID= /DNA_START= /DNA_END= /DNA_ORIENTATION=